MINYIIVFLLSFSSFLFGSENETTLRQYIVEKPGYSNFQKKIINLYLEDHFNWKPKTISPKESNTIVAYAFGNRILPNGNRLPGPMNEELADITVKLYQESGAHVFAQWEIAEAIGARIHKEDLTIIYPELDDKANVIYLSTKGVAQSIANTNNLGKVVIIAFQDHAKRCLETSQKVGMDAYMPENYQMPNQYDAQSGQPWTRDRVSFLEYEIRIHLKAAAEEL
jgi:hypothetical protein